MADKLVKHGRFAHSGIYKYAASEIPRLGLDWPPPAEIGDKSFYEVYRPGLVLVSAVKDGLFTRMTLTRQHPDDWVGPENWKENAVGFTGDTAEVEYLKDDGEISVNGSMTLSDSVALEAYDRGVVDLSPGYSATFEWKKGTHKGKPYDAVMTQVTETNHLAMVNRGRGGALSVITDHASALSQKAREIASGLWWAVRRRSIVRDESYGSDPASDATGFRSALDLCVRSRASMNDEEIGDRIEQLKTLLNDLPYGDEKSLLMRYMDDLKLMKLMPEQPVRDAVELACSLFDKLDKTAMGEARLALGDSAAEEGQVKFSLEDLLGGRRKGRVKDMEESTIKKEVGDCAECGGTGKMKDGAMCSGCKGAGKMMGKDAEAAITAEESRLGKVVTPAKSSEEQAPFIKADDDPPVVEATIPGVTDEPDPSMPASTSAVAGSTPLQSPSPSPEGVPATPGAAAQGGIQAWVGELAALMKKLETIPEFQQMKQAAVAPAAAAPATPAAPPAAAPADAGKPPASSEKPAGGAETPAPAKASPDTKSAEKAAPPAAGPKGDPAPADGPPGDKPPATDEEGKMSHFSHGSESLEAPGQKRGEEADPGMEKNDKGMQVPGIHDSVPDVSDSASSLTALISSSGRVSDAEPEGLDGLVNSIHTKGRRR